MRRSRSRSSRAFTTSATPRESSMRRPDPMPRLHRRPKRLVIALLLMAAGPVLNQPKPDATSKWTSVAGTRVGSGFNRIVSDTLLAQSLPRQALVETSAGTFIIDLAPEAAPNQVALFTKIAQE